MGNSNDRHYQWYSYGTNWRGGVDPNRPMQGVSWNDIQVFLDRLNTQQKMKYYPKVGSTIYLLMMNGFMLIVPIVQQHIIGGILCFQLQQMQITIKNHGGPLNVAGELHLTNGVYMIWLVMFLN